MEQTITLSKQITNWINSHKYFKYSGMIESLGMDQGNFARTLQAENPRIEPEIAQKIAAILADYGFKVINTTQFSPVTDEAFDGKKRKLAPDEIYPGTYAAPQAEKTLLSKKKKLTVPKKILNKVKVLKTSDTKKVVESKYLAQRRKAKQSK